MCRCFYYSRLNGNAKYHIIERENENRGVKSKQPIEFSCVQTSKKYTVLKRRIGYKYAGSGKQ